VGRPNVGKSTLFNRLLGTRKAVVSPVQGTTRDRLTGTIEWRGQRFTLMDMGGYALGRTAGLDSLVQRQVSEAIREADGFVFVCDAQVGPTPSDALIVERLRKAGKPILLAANKADSRPLVPPDFFSLGLEPACAVSALHGRGMNELLDRLLEQVKPSDAPAAPASDDTASSTRPVAVAIVGRQNVGKSSLFNALLREERTIVSPSAGTTRDAVDTRLTVRGQPLLLIDTAGLRHRRKVRDAVDHFAMSRAIEAIRRCDVALLVLDATQGVTRDDQRLMTQVLEAGCGCVLVMNKWDLAGSTMKERALAEAVHRQAPAAFFAPVIAVSAKTGLRVSRALELGLTVARSSRRGLSEERCEQLLRQAWVTQQPPRHRGRVIRLLHVRCMIGRPLRIELDTRPVGWLAPSYRHYLLKALYRDPGLAGVPIHLIVTGPTSTR